MFKLFASPWCGLFDADLPLSAALIRGAGGHSPDHRSPGGRAHRRWRKLRSAGRR